MSNRLTEKQIAALPKEWRGLVRDANKVGWRAVSLHRLMGVLAALAEANEALRVLEDDAATGYSYQHREVLDNDEGKIIDRARAEARRRLEA